MCTRGQEQRGCTSVKEAPGHMRRHKCCTRLHTGCRRNMKGVHKECTHTAVHTKSTKDTRGLRRMHKRWTRGVGDAQGCTRMPRRCKEDGWGCPREAEEGAWWGMGGERGHTEGDEAVWMGPRMGQEAAQGSPEVWQNRRAAQRMPEGCAGDAPGIPEGCAEDAGGKRKE